MAPLISVLLPFVDEGPLLDRAIRSVEAQTLGDWELLLVDDGDDARTRAIALQAASRDPRARLLDGPKGNIVGALGAGAEAARGRFLARMDADDASLPRRFELQARVLEAGTRVGLCGTHVEMGGDGIKRGRREYGQWLASLRTPACIERDLFVECPLAHPTFMLRRSAFDAAGGYRDAGWPEDYDLVLRLWAAGWGLEVVPEVLLRWTERPDRHSRTHPRYAPRAFLALKHAFLRDFVIPADRPFWQWGAGPVGKRWLRTWAPDKPVAVVDVDPRKIGQSIHGVPVVRPEDLPPPGQVFLAVAVGAPWAKAQIRGFLAARGWAEVRDFRLVS